jgi:hypothetical protein
MFLIYTVFIILREGKFIISIITHQRCTLVCSNNLSNKQRLLRLKIIIISFFNFNYFSLPSLSNLGDCLVGNSSPPLYFQIRPTSFSSLPGSISIRPIFHYHSIFNLYHKSHSFQWSLDSALFLLQISITRGDLGLLLQHFILLFSISVSIFLSFSF